MWNILLKRTNKVERVKREEQRNDDKQKLLKRATTLKKDIKKFNKDDTIYYKIKDKFGKIYPVFFGILIIWTLPVIFLVSNLGKSAIYLIVLLIYGILTVPIALISFLVPTVKFFAFDLGKVIADVKVFASGRYMVAIFFEENRLVVPVLKKLDKDGQFNYQKKPYVSDKSASFLTTSKIILAFYVKNIPNPLKFDFRKYINMYIDAKSKDKKAKVVDFDGKVLDVAFSSENLRDYKKAKLFEEFFRDYAGEINKVLFAVIGLAGTFGIIFLIAYMLKG